MPWIKDEPIAMVWLYPDREHFIRDKYVLIYDRLSRVLERLEPDRYYRIFNIHVPKNYILARYCSRDCSIRLGGCLLYLVLGTFENVKLVIRDASMEEFRKIVKEFVIAKDAVEYLRKLVKELRHRIEIRPVIIDKDI